METLPFPVLSVSGRKGSPQILCIIITVLTADSRLFGLHVTCHTYLQLVIFLSKIDSWQLQFSFASRGSIQNINSKIWCSLCADI